MGWVFQSAYDAFDKYRDNWDEINNRCGNHILLDSKFVEPLIRYFGNRDVLLSLPNRSSNSAMLLVHKRRTGFWETFQPAQAPVGLVLIGPGEDSVGVVQKIIRDLPGLTLGVSLLQQDSALTNFKNLRSRQVDVLSYIDTPNLILSDSFEDYWKAQGKEIDVTHNLTKRLRRLTRLNVRLTLRVDRHPDQVAECVAQHGKLEQTGWKGREGTAVTAENQQGAFYKEILVNFCERNEAVMYRLYFNDDVAASQLALERNGTLIFLKTAYDEKQKEWSPGFLLQLEILKFLHAEGRVKTIEFYGRARDWHRKWGAKMRPMYHVNFYRGSWVPAMRRVVKNLVVFLTKKGLNERSHSSSGS